MVAVAISPKDLTWSRNKVDYHLVVSGDDGNPYTPTNMPPNYKLKVEVYFERTYESGLFGDPIAELETVPDSSGLVPFDLQEILHKAYLKSLVNDPIPQFGIDAPYLADNLRKYKIRYTEEYGNPVEEIGWVDLPEKQIIVGGIDQEIYAKTDYLSQISASNSLLTWYPNGKEIAPNQPEYISWFNYTGEDKEVLIGLERYTDSGKLSTRFIYDSMGITVKDGQTLIIPVDYTNLGLTDEVTKYSVQVIDRASNYDSGDATYLSPIRTYHVNHNYYTNSKLILYINGFFLPETLRLTGEEKKGLNVSREISSGILQSNYSALSKEKYQYNFDWDNVFTFRTGYLSKAELDALQEMLIYNAVYEINDTGYRPILLNGKRYEILDSFKFLHALEFSAVRALKPINYINFFLPIVLSCHSGSIEFANGIIEFANGIITF